MKATIVLVILVAALAMAALAAQPVTPPAVAHVAEAALSLEPAWMVLSGAALLVLAGIVRRLTP
jgi:hypothetical protein